MAIILLLLYCEMKTENETNLGKRILLVDDEGLMRQSIKSFLTQEDHVVVEANNGAEAFALFTKSKFDVVVTDCVMPFVTGDELAARIRKIARCKIEMGNGVPANAA